MTKHSRRTLLRGAGGAALSVPWLEAMAQTPSDRIKRFVVFWSPEGLGADRSRWEPKGTETNFTLSPMLAPLEKHKSKLIILSGMDLEASYHGGQDNGHQEGVISLLTGVAIGADGADTPKDHLTSGGPSLDHLMGQTSIGAQTPFRVLRLGVRPLDEPAPPPTVDKIPFRTLSFQAARQALPAEEDPAKVFNRLMGVSGPAGVNAGRVAARRQTVLDAVLGDYNDLVPRLGAEDRRRMDSYATAIREIERQLTSLPQATRSCKLPDVGTTNGLPFPAVGKLQMDILALALSCDLTRIATLFWSHTGSEIIHTWAGVKAGHHTGLSHGGSADDQFKVQLWYEQQFGYFLDKLDSYQEGLVSLLDNTVVLRAREFSIPNDHSRRGVPLLLAGSCGGYFKTGQYLKLPGVAHNNLLVPLMNAMGMPGKIFGDKAFCTRPLNLT